MHEMFFDLAQGLTNEMNTLTLMLLMIKFIIHVIFAGAVAHDSGQLTKHGQDTYLVSGLTWAFATLAGGVWVAAVYWLIHHCNLGRR